MKTVEQFTQQKSEVVKIMERLLAFLDQGEQFEVENEADLQAKVAQSINEVEGSRLKVALIGGFSEGKTSIAAAWSEHFDPETMKIDVAESSDSVIVYHLDDFDLIDTPGLFGFKETDNQVKYKMLTKQYISEANLLLYVMNPSNPIKDSHEEELDWLFKELGLLPRTVFVLSKFDEEVDIEDPSEYQERLKTKRENVTQRLRDFGIIEAAQTVPIVAIAANPFGEGFEYWQNNMDEYQTLSHITDLQDATVQQIKRAGGVNALQLATSQSVIKDVLHRQMPMVEAHVAELNEETDSLESALADLRNAQENIESKILAARLSLRENLTHYFSDLIVQAEGTDMDTFSEFYERNIGKDGAIINAAIQGDFEREVGQINRGVAQYKTTFDASVTHYKTMTEKLAHKGLQGGSNFFKNYKVSNETVLKVRDVVLPNFKFKPWGATKFAEGLGFLGPVMDVVDVAWSTYTDAKQKKQFESAKQEISTMLHDRQAALLSLIDSPDDFAKQFFPQYLDLQKQYEEMQKVVTDRQHLQQQFEAWKAEGKAIDDDVSKLLV